jgi:hypothetical protein
MKAQHKTLLFVVIFAIAVGVVMVGGRNVRAKPVLLDASKALTSQTTRIIPRLENDTLTGICGDTLILPLTITASPKFDGRVGVSVRMQTAWPEDVHWVDRSWIPCAVNGISTRTLTYTIQPGESAKFNIMFPITNKIKPGQYHGYVGVVTGKTYKILPFKIVIL